MGGPALRVVALDHVGIASTGAALPLVEALGAGALLGWSPFALPASRDDRWRPRGARRGSRDVRRYDAVVRGGLVVLPEADDPTRVDVAIADGRVAALLDPDQPSEAEREWAVDG